MPELPEVETTRRGIEPHVRGQVIRRVIVRERRLRWPVPPELEQQLSGARILAVTRRGKYLIFTTKKIEMIVHLGMSGHLRFLCEADGAEKHDHIDWVMKEGIMRLTDPRRFGCVLLARQALKHPLIAELGPEPFSAEFDTDYLHASCRGRRVAIKQHIMNARIVVGVGNIYANEALHRAGIHPLRAAGRVSKQRLGVLVTQIRAVLDSAITEGGTTLRDFVRADGNPGYFRVSLQAYDREGLACVRCGGTIRRKVLGQRATYYCSNCQK